MKIRKIDIREFGGLSDFTAEFGDGITVIQGDNETGKSTLSAFIRFIFYGLPSRRGAESGERARGLSWMNGVAAGSMEVETPEGRFRIERRVADSPARGSTDRCAIVDLSTGCEVHRGESPDKVFLGVPPSVFDSTCSVRQSAVGELNAKELSGSVENLLFSADAAVNTNNALKKLELARRELLPQKGPGGRIPALTAARDGLKQRLAAAELAAAGTVSLRGTVEKYRGVTADLRRRRAEAEERCHAYETFTTLRRFDSFHATERRVESLKAEKRRLAEECGCGGWIPDRDYVAGLDSLSRKLNAAEAARNAQCDRAAAFRGTRPENADAARCADDIDAAGGAEAVCDRYRGLLRRRAGRIAAVCVLAVLGLCALTLGLLSFFAGVPVTMPAAACFGLSVCGFITAVIGFSLIGGCGKLRRAAEKTLTDFGYAPRRRAAENADGDEPGSFPAYAAACASARAVSDAWQKKMGLMEVDLRQLDMELTEVRKKCRAALAKFGFGKNAADSELPGLLLSAADEAAAVVSADEKLDADIAKYAASAEESAARLSGSDEAFLRAHLNPEAIAYLESANPGALTIERDALNRQYEAAVQKLNEAEKNLAVTESRAENPARLAVELEAAQRELDEAQRLYDAVVLAHSSISGAGDSLRRGVTPRLREKAGRIISDVTDGKYSELGVGEDFSVTLKTPDGVRDIAYLSAGTRDTAFFALRVALLSVLFPGNEPPMILDEVCARLDDGRTGALLALLARLSAGVPGEREENGENGVQCVLLTCHAREADLLRKSGTDFRLIRI